MGPIIYTNYLNTATLQNQFFSPYTFTANTDWTSINHDSILKWRPPKKYSSKYPQKSAFSHVLPFKHQRENKVFQNRVNSQLASSKPLLAASSPTFWLLATNNFPTVTTWQSVGSFSTRWAFMLGFLMFGKGQMSCSVTLMILFTHSDHLADAYLLYLAFE